jgi:hypothetical protein
MLRRLGGALVLLCLCGLIPLIASAGDIYGTVQREDGAAAERVTVHLELRGVSYTSTTNEAGSYRVRVREGGPGSLWVTVGEERLFRAIYRRPPTVVII